jgi:hypothetical protein
MKIFTRIFYVAFLMLCVGLSQQVSAQTNSYLGLNGGFEGAATIVNATTNSAPVATNWTKSTTTATIASETTTVRSGAKSMKVSSTSTTLCRVFSPSMTISASTTAWQVQYYRRSASTTATVENQTGNYRNGSEQANGTYTKVTAANTWEKVTYSPSSTTSATSAAAHMLVRATGGGGDTFYDDFVLYEGAADNTAPNVPGSFTFSGQTTSSIGVSWAAASGGVDGGGYIVVRGTTDPTTAPNVNGIYATTNTIGAGTVVYQGTGTSFTDSGLAAGTTYFYRVYTYDKAYNYSAATTGNSATTTGLAVDGIINAGEYGTHTDGSNQQSSATGTWYMNWDATNLYLGVTGGTTTEGAVMYLDKNPLALVNGGSNTDGNLVGQNYDGSNFANLQFRADLVVYFKSGYDEYRTADGSGGWSTANTSAVSAVAGTTREISIPWSAIGGMPASFNWFGYISYTGGGAYASVPTENPGSGAGTGIGASATWERYYTVSTTTIGSATPPFSRNSYTYTSSFDISAIGAMTIYDFTMNSSGRYASRTGNVTGNWVIGGNFTIGAGTVYMGSGGSGYGTTAIAGNLNLLGGTYDMDATTATTSVTGNVTIASGATLKLSSQIGGDFNIGGAWSNLGTFTPNSRLVQFNGALAQTLTGATTFDYLTLNNGLGLTLVNPITVNQPLVLTSGKITLGANSLTALGTVTASSTNYIVTNGAGQLKRTIGAGAVTFPVGNTAYNPIILDNTGGTSDVYGVNVLDGTYATPFDATKVVNRRWQISEAVAGGSNLSVVGQYNTADTFGGAFAAGTTPVIGFYNGTSWTTAVATAAGSNPFTYSSNSNLSPADLTSGTQYFGLGKDNAFISLATKLVITSITPATPSATDVFNVTVQAQDVYNLPAAVVAGTAFALSTNGNAGAIGGTITGTILAATNSITVTGVTLATAGTGVTITATRTSGDTLTAGTSATFTVLAAPTQLAFVGVPGTGSAGVNLASFTVEVRRADNSVDTNYVGNVTITKASGTGTLSGTTSVAVVSGVATFNAIQFDNASTYTLYANSGSFSQITSGNIVVSLVPVVLAGWDFFGQSAPTSVAATTFNSNLVSTSSLNLITRGPNAAASAGANSFRTVAFQNDGISTANTDYFQTTLKAVAGYSINISSITASVVGTASFSNSPGVSMQFAYSLDGTTFTLIGSPVNVTGTTPAAMPTISTTGVTALQNVSPGTTIYIRYYASGQTTTGGWGFSSATSGTNGLAFNGNIYCTQPTAYAVTGGGNYCPGGTGVAVGLANSQNNISYQLKIGGVNTGSPVAGTGSAITFGLQTALGTYTVEATNGNSPCSYSTTMTGSAVLSSASTTSNDGGATWSNGTPSADKSVIFDGSSATLGADFAACTLTLTNNAVVSVTSGFDITLTGALTVDSGSTFTLNNNANLLQSGTANTNSGNIIVNRNSSALKRLDYTLWSSPVTGQGVYAFSPFTFANRFYVYRTATNLYNNADIGFSNPIVGLDGNGVNGTDGNNVQFAAGKGYLIRMPWDHPTAATVWNGTFTGVPNSGDVPFTMTNNGAGFRFNLVGNPYPSPISMTQFVSDNSTNITGTLYFWRETNGTTANNAYCSWAGGTFVSNNQAQVVNPNGIIRTGQGFIVEALNASTNLTFKNGQRSSDNANQFFRTNANVTNTVDTNRFWLNLYNATGEFSQMAAGYMTDATDGVDLYDGKNINTGSVLLNSILDDTDYTIQGKSLPFSTADVIPLSNKITTAGQYTIALDHVDGLFTDSSQPIYLKDNLMNTEQNLQTGSYTFTSDAGTFNNRFEITYESQLAIENPTFTANNIVIYSQSNDFVINSGYVSMSSVKVFDIRGRLIQEKKGINASQTTIGAGLANGVLLVQITSNDGITVTKKVIR